MATNQRFDSTLNMVMCLKVCFILVTLGGAIIKLAEIFFGLNDFFMHE